MKLNYNSTSSKLYRWFYDTHRMPETLCPYFWKLVFAWTLTIILSPLLLPTLILRKVTNDSDEEATFGPYVAIGIFIYGLIFFIISIGFFISAYWITYYQGSIGFDLYVAGIIVTVIGSAALISWGANELKKLIRDRKYKQTVWSDELDMDIPNPHYREPKPNIIIEFIKAKYNKYCPKIDWN
jgi:hypothetical protein